MCERAGHICDTMHHVHAHGRIHAHVCACIRANVYKSPEPLRNARTCTQANRRNDMAGGMRAPPAGPTLEVENERSRILATGCLAEPRWGCVGGHRGRHEGSGQEEKQNRHSPVSRHALPGGQRFTSGQLGALDVFKDKPRVAARPPWRAAVHIGAARCPRRLQGHPPAFIHSTNDNRCNRCSSLQRRALRARLDVENDPGHGRVSRHRCKRRCGARHLWGRCGRRCRAQDARRDASSAPAPRGPAGNCDFRRPGAHEEPSRARREPPRRAGGRAGASRGGGARARGVQLQGDGRFPGPARRRKPLPAAPGAPAGAPGECFQPCLSPLSAARFTPDFDPSAPRALALAHYSFWTS
jgi:hypothetical protein